VLHVKREQNSASESETMCTNSLLVKLTAKAKVVTDIL